MLVLPFARTENASAATYTIFGKLPNRADFVRVNATHPVSMELDVLIQKTLERMEWDGGVEQYDSRHPVEFQLCSRDQRHVMVGVLKPSQDQYNRRFPLVAAAILPIESLEGGTEIFPIAFEVFFDGLREQVENAVDNSVEAIACRQFLETQLAPYDKTGADIELAEIVAKRFMATHTVAYLDEILRVGNPAASLEQAVLNLVFYQSHLRRFDNAVTNQVIVLPLGSNAGERPLLAATWLTLLSALINSDSADMGMKISYIHTHRLSNNASIAINIGKISDGFVCAMLGNMGNDGVVLDMTSEHEAWKSHRMYAEVSYALGRLLSNGDLSLTALVEFVGDVGKKLEANV